MTEIQPIDRALLGLLAQTPRITSVALATQLGLSRNTVQARLGRLARGGAFRSYERSFSPAALGFPLQAFVSIWVQQNKLDEIVQALSEIPEVLQAFGLSGQVDILALVACEDAHHLFGLDARILAIDGIERAETALVMDEVIPYRVMKLVDARAE